MALRRSWPHPRRWNCRCATGLFGDDRFAPTAQTENDCFLHWVRFELRHFSSARMRPRAGWLWSNVRQHFLSLNIQGLLLCRLPALWHHFTNTKVCCHSRNVHFSDENLKTTTKTKTHYKLPQYINLNYKWIEFCEELLWLSRNSSNPWCPAPICYSQSSVNISLNFLVW